MKDQWEYKNDQKRIELWLSLSLLLYLTIEAINAVSLKEQVVYLLSHLHVFLMNYLIILTFTAPCLLFNKMLFVFNNLSIVLIGFTFASRVMLVVRGLPLRWTDLFILRDGLSIAWKYISMPVIGIISVLILCGIVIVVKSYGFQYEVRSQKPVMTFVTFLTLLNTVIINGFDESNLVAKNLEYTERIGYNHKIQSNQVSDEDIAKRYEENGFLYSFLNSYEEQEPYVPEAYDENTLRKVEEELNKVKGVDSIESAPNIIFLQIESFIDPYSLKGVTYSEDPIPYMRKYIEGANSGVLKMPDINTARTEFEILTGVRLENLFNSEVPYTSHKIDERALESIAQLLDEKDYYTTAMHNNNGSFYKRNENYNKLGFKQFIPLEGMKNVTYMGDWPKDEVFLPYIKETLESTKQKDFIFAVTVATHSSYHYNYENSKSKIKVGGNVSEGAKGQVQDYVDRLHETDQFVGALSKFVEEYKEPIVLVVYGDHIPTMDVITTDTEYPRYEVPYFVVSNKEVPKALVSSNESLPAYELYPTLFKAYGLAGGIVCKGQEQYKSQEDYKEKMDLIDYDIVLGKGYLTDYNTRYNISDLYVRTND